ncbi:MAG: serine/threonine protein kinase [Acidobacteria bacterium]|nr:serine/threonine protein kinase [Acidobacteriota bacterium]
MGAVYLCHQVEPIKREVALKLIHISLRSSESLLRFEHERQALARLNHPSIAQLYEGGTTNDGFPYFVMEPIDGERITNFCDHQRLDLKSRLTLILKVCDGLTHAHQKGILHRDIKPSNILVTTHNGQPWPKIIDFGVAKAIDQPLIDQTLETGDRLMGTPAYMSPEVIAGHDLDTRADVYSLGIIMYELLTGTRPFGEDQSGLIPLMQEISRSEANRPSDSFKTLDDVKRSHIALARRTDEPNLIRTLRGDLDWIVLKAIAKDRAERYGSPADLAADIQRYLHHEPIVAHPPSTIYLARKFVRRHSGLVMASLLIVGALAAGIVARTLEAQRANREADLARQALAEASELSDFMVGLFEWADPTHNLGEKVTARVLLDRGAETVGQRFKQQPLAEAQFRKAIGRSYSHLGLLDEADLQFQMALSLLEVGADQHRETWLMALLDLVSIRHKRGIYEEAHHYHDQAAPFLATSSLKCQALYNDVLAHLASSEGDYDLARDLAQKALHYYESEEPDNLGEIGKVLNKWALIEKLAGQYDESERLHRRNLALRESYWGDHHPDVAETLQNLGTTLQLQAEYDEALDCLDRALVIRKNVFGPRHDWVASTLSSKAGILLDLGRIEDAIPVLEEAIDIRKEALGDKHPRLATTYTQLAKAHFDRAEYDQAEQVIREVLAIREATLPPTHISIVKVRINLCVIQMTRGKYKEAATNIQQIINDFVETHGADRVELVNMYNTLGACCMYLNEFPKAIDAYEHALSTAKLKLKPDHPAIADAMDNLGSAHARLNDYEKAEPLMREAYSIRKAALPADHPNLATSMHNLAVMLKERGQYQEAEELLQEALKSKESSLGPNHPKLVTTLNSVADLATLQSRWDQAETTYRRALEIIQQQSVPIREEKLVLEGLIKVLKSTGRDVEAQELEVRLKRFGT